MSQSKKCNKCRKIKPISEFGKDKSRKDGLFWCCKSCRIAPRRKIDLHRRYGISLRQYEKLLEKQNGYCAICGRYHTGFKNCLDVDHNHETGKVRGLLCPSCNRGLGNFKDNRRILRKAIQYLEKGN